MLGSSSSEESLSRHHSSDSESTVAPRLDILNETTLSLQTSAGKPVIVGHYAPADLVTVSSLHLVIVLYSNIHLLLTSNIEIW